jgi:hypothetical protein
MTSEGTFATAPKQIKETISAIVEAKFVFETHFYGIFVITGS